MSLEILPLAITMMAGPQIMSAIIFLTTPKPVKISASFIAAVAIATTVGVIIARALGALLGNIIPLGDPSDPGSIGHIIQYALVGLLVLLALKNYVRRETIEPPRWLGTLQSGDWKTAAKTGLLLILVFPSDVIILLTVGVNLEHNDLGVVGALPFIAATTLIAALPLLLYLLFHSRAERLMPQVREWMNSHSWLVNIIVCVIFIVLILF
jgi:Sap, sulfolipid-1-addressing protein